MHDAGSPCNPKMILLTAGCDLAYPGFLYEQALSRDSSCNCPPTLANLRLFIKTSIGYNEPIFLKMHKFWRFLMAAVGSQVLNVDSNVLLSLLKEVNMFMGRAPLSYFQICDIPEDIKTVKIAIDLLKNSYLTNIEIIAGQAQQKQLKFIWTTDAEIAVENECRNNEGVSRISSKSSIDLTIQSANEVFSVCYGNKIVQSMQVVSRVSGNPRYQVGISRLNPLEEGVAIIL